MHLCIRRGPGDWHKTWTRRPFARAFARLVASQVNQSLLVAQVRPVDSFQGGRQLLNLIETASISDQSGHSRVPVNLLKSAHTVMEKLYDSYKQLWAYKEKQIQHIQNSCFAISEAAVTLAKEHLIATEVPRALYVYQHCHQKTQAAHQQFTVKIQQLKQMLSKIRVSAINKWIEQQRAPLHHFLNTLSMTLEGSAGGEAALDQFDDLQHSAMELDHRIELYSQSKGLLQQPAPELEFLMNDWLRVIQQALHLTQGLNEQTDQASGLPHPSSLAHPTNQSLYQKFRTAAGQLERQQLKNTEPLNREYTALKEPVQEYRAAAQGVQGAEGRRGGQSRSIESSLE